MSRVVSRLLVGCCCRKPKRSRIFPGVGRILASPLNPLRGQVDAVNEGMPFLATVVGKEL